MLREKTTIFLLLLFSFVLLNACGKKENTDKTTSGDKKEQTNTGDQKAPGDQNQNQSKSNELGITEGLPKDYPSEVPQPKNAKCLGSLNTSEGTTVTFESTEKPRDIMADFASGVEKSGFKKGEDEMMSDDGGMALWNKDKKEVSIMLAWDKDKKISSVVVTYK
jgi:hypothetical protein